MDPTEETRRLLDEEAPLNPEPTRRNRRRKAEAGLGGMIGNAIVGFDYQVFRATKPPAILVESAKPVRGLSGEGGARLTVGFPGDAPVPAPAPADPDPDADGGAGAGLATSDGPSARGTGLR